jgi:hypothetical protein
MDRLLEIAGIFEMKPEDVLSFDEKVVFNIYGSQNCGQLNGTQNNFPEDLKKLYEENARLQAEQIKTQQEMIEMLKERLKGK